MITVRFFRTASLFVYRPRGVDGFLLLRSATPLFPGALFGAAPSRAVPFIGTSPFFGAGLAVPAVFVGRFDPDC